MIETKQSGAAPAARLLKGFHEIADDYDIVLSDVWGVVHDGQAAFPRACDALRRFREKGGAVVLITNAPRPAGPIIAQMRAYGVPDDAWDGIVTSGDVTLELMAERDGASCHFIGPPRDEVLFSELTGIGGKAPARVGIEAASYVVCSGLFDDAVETPEDYDPVLDVMVRRGLDMVCANPDLVVHRGDQLLYCAGALADRLEQKGGRAIYAGKPHAPIYAKAMAKALALKPQASPRVLCIGDAIRTDVAGAAGQGYDALFVTHGIHRDVLHDETGGLKPDELDRLLAESPLQPVASIPQLWW